MAKITRLSEIKADKQNLPASIADEAYSVYLRNTLKDRLTPSRMKKLPDSVVEKLLEILEKEQEK